MNGIGVGSCSSAACRTEGFERGLSHRGLPLKRKFRPRCCAKTRAGAPCIMRVVPGKRRCQFRPDSRSAATALHFAVLRGFLRFRVRPHNARARVHVQKPLPSLVGQSTASAPTLFEIAP